MVSLAQLRKQWELKDAYGQPDVWQGGRHIEVVEVTADGQMAITSREEVPTHDMTRE